MIIFYRKVVFLRGILYIVTVKLFYSSAENLQGGRVLHSQPKTYRGSHSRHPRFICLGYRLCGELWL